MTLFAIVATLAVHGIAHAQSSSLQRPSPQQRPGTYDDLRASQAIGRVLVSSDGAIVLYEWGHPYLNWVPDVSWLAPDAARRMETVLFQVDARSHAPKSEYLFYPSAGSTYWLGDLSPDNRNVILFELNHDKKDVRAGVWNIAARKVHWFSPRPDDARMESLTVWVSNEEFLYPTKQGAKFAIASTVTGLAEPCPTCTAEEVRQIRGEMLAATKRVLDSTDLQVRELKPDSHLVAAAANSSVALYVTDSSKVLSLTMRAPGREPRVLFENARQSLGSSRTSD